MKIIKKYIEKYGKSQSEDDYLQIWKKIKTIEELFYCNKEFIKGNIYGSCYHLGPLHEDSLALVLDLIQLHDNGFLTVNGQGPLLIYDSHKTNKNFFVSIEQRPYLEGYIENKYIEDILKYILNFNSNMTEDKIFYRIYTKDKTITNIDKIHNVTREKSYHTIEQKNDMIWETPTNLHTDYNLYDQADHEFQGCNPIISKLIKRDYSTLCLSTEKYGSDISLEKFLLDFFVIKK
jgi:hypothetical protein